MINEPTTPTSVVNAPVSSASVVNNLTLDVGVTNLVSNVAVPTNIPLSTVRTEGLWVSLVFPWDIEDIWQYEAIVKSNTVVSNI